MESVPGSFSRRSLVATRFPASVPYRVLVADDSLLLRQLLVERLHGMADMEVVAEAADGVEAVDRAQEVRPEIVLLDLQMPRMSGLQALRAILDALPDTRVVVLTNHADSVYRRTCMAAGASRFLDKSGDLDTLDQVLREVAQA